MSHGFKLGMTLVAGVVALILEFGLHDALFAQILVTVIGAFVALTMLIEMIRTLRSGKYGVDMLAIMAIVATLAVRWRYA